MNTRCAVTALMIVIPCGALSAQPIDSRWSAPSSGSWQDGANWTNGVPNSPFYFATIDAVGPNYTVTLADSLILGRLTLDSNDARLEHVQGTLTAGLIDLRRGMLRLIGGELASTTVQIGSGSLRVTGDSTLRDVDVNGSLSVRSGAEVRLIGSTRFDLLGVHDAESSVRMSAGYTLYDNIETFGPAFGSRRITNAGGGVVTIAGSGAIVHRLNTSGDLEIVTSDEPFNLRNEGRIRAEDSSRTLHINTDTFENAGLLQIQNGRMRVGADVWSNTGVIDLDGGVFTIAGTMDASSGIGTFVRGAGTINVEGTILLGGSAMTLDDSTGAFRLFGGTIRDGAVHTQGFLNSVLVTSQGGTLRDVHLDGVLRSEENNGRVRLEGDTRFDRLRMWNGLVAEFGEGFVLRDEISTDKSILGGKIDTDAGSIVIGETGLVRASMGRVDIGLNSEATLVNHGVLRADGVGTMILGQDTFVNLGRIEVAENAEMRVRGRPWLNLGHISLTGGRLRVGGDWDTSFGIGTFERSGGSFELSARVANENSTLTLNDSTGSWRLTGGTITGGIVEMHGGNRFELTSSGGTFRDVDLRGELVTVETGAGVTLEDMRVFESIRLSHGETTLQYRSGVAITGHLVAEGAEAGMRTIDFGEGSPPSLITLAPSGSIRLLDGTGGDLTLEGRLRNQGLVSVEAEGRRLFAHNLRNEGVLRVDRGELFMFGVYANTGRIEVNGGRLRLFGNIDASNGFGEIVRTGGEVELVGGISLGSSTLRLDALTGSWDLLGGAVLGGTVEFADGHRLRVTDQRGSLVSTHIRGSLNADVQNAHLSISGSTDFDAIYLSGGNSRVDLFNSYTLRSDVIATGSLEGDRRIVAQSQFRLTLAESGSIILAEETGADLHIDAFSQTGGDVMNFGTIRAAAAGRRLLTEVNRMENHGALVAENASRIELRSNEYFINAGDIIVRSAGSVIIETVQAFDSTGLIGIEVGPNGWIEDAAVAITGPASLAGTLEVTASDDLSVGWGDVWTVLTYPEAVGDFSEVLLPESGNSMLRWWHERQADRYLVGVRDIADANADGVVDFVDLDAVLADYGASGLGLLGDVDTNGVVDFADLNTVLGRFGMIAPRAVPGPGALGLLAVAACGSIRRRQRSR